jgi:hypothetical protein
METIKEKEVEPYGSWDTVYRGFHITPSYMRGYDYVSDDYDWAPDGVMGASGWAETIEDAKEEIDEYYRNRE